MKEIQVVIEEAELYQLHAARTNSVAVSAHLRLAISLALESFVPEFESASLVELRRESA